MFSSFQGSLTPADGRPRFLAFGARLGSKANQPDRFRRFAGIADRGLIGLICAGKRTLRSERCGARNAHFASLPRLRRIRERRYRLVVSSSAAVAGTRVIEVRRFLRGLAAAGAIGCAALASPAPARAADVDPSKMSADEIKALER